MKVFTIYGHDDHLGHVTWSIYTNFFPPSHGCPTWNLGLLGQAALEKTLVDDGRTPEDGYTISSPCEPSAFMN